MIIIACFFACTSNVFAASAIKSRNEIKIDGKNVYKRYQNVAVNTTTINGGTAGILTVTIDGVDYFGFCIDFGVNIKSGQTDTPISLSSYFQNVLSESATNELLKKLTLYRKYGYGSSGRTTDKYYLATQKLIWEAINDTGFYNSDFYASRSGKKINIDDFDWTINGEVVIDLSAEISAIETSIKNHNSTYYKTPSFCSSQNKIEIEVGQTAEYTDNNNVLSQYQVTCSAGIVCQKNENKLTVTAKDKAGNHQITFLKPAQGKESYVYRVDGQQGIIVIEEGKYDPVSCEFGIDSFKNEKTADTKIIYFIAIGLFSGIVAYISYYTKKSIEGLK